MSENRVVSLTWDDVRDLGGVVEPYHMIGVVIYKSDYSDLDEPYLSAVKRAEKRVAAARGIKA